MAKAATVPMTTSPFTIMCFSWNAAGLKLCETMSQAKANQARSGILHRRPCIAPDFFEDIRSNINLRRPSLVVMTTQDEDSSGTYFHAELLPAQLPEIGYFLLKRDTLAGVGEAASGAILPGVPTGSPSGSTLRISIYARDDVLPMLQAEDRVLTQFFSNDGHLKSSCNQGDRTSGAIAAYVWHPVYGKFAFINTHFPIGMNTLGIGSGLDYQSYRVAVRATNTLCMLKLYNQLVNSIPPESRPDHIFLLGDLNYDIVIPDRTPAEIIAGIAGNVTAQTIKNLQYYDELRKAVQDVPLLGFKEGVAGEGPLFFPTWRLARGRPDACTPKQGITRIDPVCFDEPDETVSAIGWHDRILYKELMTSNYITHCREYSRLDVRNIHASTHAGVIGFFEMHSVQ